MIEAIVKFLLAYLIGTIMGGQVVGKLRGGVDLRQHGSGNVGATNALRTQGKAFALAVLLIDVGKGVLAVLLIPQLPWPLAEAQPWPLDWQAYACGVGVALGHCYPVWYRFQGGKGVATLAGVFGAVLPASLLLILPAFLLVVMLTGYVSLATLAASAAAGLYVACIDARGAWSAAGGFTAFMALLVVFKHRENIGRLFAGTESRFDKFRVLGNALDKWLDR